MSRQSKSVIPIDQHKFAPHSDQLAELAYNLWLARSFREGSPEEDLLAALWEVGGFHPSGLSRVSKGEAAGKGMNPATALEAATHEFTRIVAQLLQDRADLEQEICFLKKGARDRTPKSKRRPVPITQVRQGSR